MAVAVATKRWTIEELHSLPDDGNKYELVLGQLFVTPAPRQYHQFITHRLADLLMPFVLAYGLGMVWQARSIIRWGDNEVEPDIFVRAVGSSPEAEWTEAPRPLLVIEVLSDATRRRDLKEKRELYIDEMRIPEYWIVDPDARSVRVARPGGPDTVTQTTLTWLPDGVAEPLTIDLGAVFQH